MTKEMLLARAEWWAEHAWLRSARTCSDPKCEQYTVEDALMWVMFHIWAAENFDDA
jgi:hypothetical protein